MRGGDGGSPSAGCEWSDEISSPSLWLRGCDGSRIESGYGHKNQQLAPNWKFKFFSTHIHRVTEAGGIKLGRDEIAPHQWEEMIRSG